MLLRPTARQVFLATNSLWDYTTVVMNFIISDNSGSNRNEDWLNLFDAVVTGCRKPGYFTERMPLFEVHSFLPPGPRATLILPTAAPNPSGVE